MPDKLLDQTILDTLREEPDAAVPLDELYEALRDNPPHPPPSRKALADSLLLLAQDGLLTVLDRKVALTARGKRRKEATPC